MSTAHQNVLASQDWERIFDAFQDGIYVTNSNGLTLYVNSAYERITGIAAERVMGRCMTDIVREGILSSSITQRVIRECSEVRSEQTTQNGTRVTLHGIPIYTDGRISLVVTVVRDISVIKYLQKELNQSRAMMEQYKSRLEELDGNKNFVAVSQKFHAAVALAQKVAGVDTTVLILGESGTGKEVLAREIHEKSSRRDQIFLKTNCGAIPENLLEAELFGYVGGAFTGAQKGGHIGLFEAASDGTLFLDEIGDMPLHLQVKLLRVLQERTVTRVGSTKAIPINTRIVAATNRDLEQMVKRKEFREDLFYRLNIVAIKSPPLRERKEDIPGLTNFFVNKLNERYHLTKRLSPEILAAFMDHDWPGNVRELENMIERVLVTSVDDFVTLDSVRLPWTVVGSTAVAEEVAEPFEAVPLRTAVERVERQLLLNAAKHYRTTYQIAEALEISQPSASRKLKKYGIRLLGEPSC